MKTIRQNVKMTYPTFVIVFRIVISIFPLFSIEGYYRAHFNNLSNIYSSISLFLYIVNIFLFCIFSSYQYSQ
jgi:hypothetical protein